MKNIVSFLFLTLLSIACSQDEKVKVVVNKNKQGKVVSEIRYLQDTIKHGLARYYYLNGDLRGEVDFVYGRRRRVDNYWHGGILKSRVTFSEDEQESNAIWYYRNGQVESKSSWLGEVQFGSVFLYDSLGSLTHYNCKDHFGNTFYDIRWNSNGNKILEEGFVFSPQVLLATIDSSMTTKVNQNVVIKIAVADPPDSKAKLWIGYILQGRKEIEHFKEYPIKDNNLIYSYSFSNPGLYKLIIVGQLKDKNGNMVMTYSKVIRLRVIE